LPFYFPDTPDLPLPPGHRFPASKYRLLREAARAERLFDAIGLVASPLAAVDDLLRAHAAAYVRDVLEGTLPADAMRRIGVPWSPVLRQRSLATVGGALASARAALCHGISGQLAGGTHHAHRTFGSGYCVLNDLAVAALALLDGGEVSRVTILDCDVHQGDGTAAILADEARVQTISIHGEKNFPFRKHASDLDIALADGTGDAAYLQALETALAVAEGFAPDLLLYLSGADALAADRLGRLSLTPAGLAARDTRVLEFAKARRLPVAIAIGGGYAEPIEVTVEAYLATFRAARAVFGF
jgi:acetoin utilization deacetylase AcuC-like enzyme